MVLAILTDLYVAGCLSVLAYVCLLTWRDVQLMRERKRNRKALLKRLYAR